MEKPPTPQALQNLEIYVSPGRIVLEWDIPIETDIAEYAIERVESEEGGVETIVRFVIPKPTQGPENPHVHPTGLLEWWVDVGAGREALKDKAVIVGTVYTYRVAAIDEEGQEGVPTGIIAPIAVP